jgi:hypothetical protein
MRLKDARELAMSDVMRRLSRLGNHTTAADDFVARHLRFNQMIVDSRSQRAFSARSRADDLTGFDSNAADTP